MTMGKHSSLRTIVADGRPEGSDHAYTGKFGFGIPTHCGATEQDNTWDGDWGRFFADRRLGDLVRRLGDPTITKEWEKLKEK